MRKIRRLKLITFLVSGIFLTDSVFASSLFSGQPATIFGNSFKLLINVLENTWVRQGLSLIAIIFIFFKLYEAIIKKISIFAESSKGIAIPLALMSTLAIYWKIPSEKIANLFLFFAAAIVIIYLITWILKFANFMKGGYNPNKAIRDEKHIKQEANEGMALENKIINTENTLGNGINQEAHNDIIMRKLLEELKKRAEAGQNDLKKIYNDTKRD